MDLEERLIEQALAMGASYVGLLRHNVASSVITAENGALRSYVNGKTSGLGVRVVVDGGLGIAASTELDSPKLQRRVEYAVKMAKAARGRVEYINFADTQPLEARWKSKSAKSPDSMSDKDKIVLTMDANKSAMLGSIKNSVTSLAWLEEQRIFKSSEGANVKCELIMTGLAQSCVAKLEGNMEFLSDSRSQCAGFEFISGGDWCSFSRGVAETSLKAVKAKAPKAGIYRAVADPDLVGLILHEALGHASEADLVTTGESVLDSCLDKEVASPVVTIVDDGLVDGGYLLPYDDEGVVKKRQTIVEKGVLKGFLHSRGTARKMKGSPTGNARVQSFSDMPIVRQTNFFMEAGDLSFEELVEDVDEGLYICGRGARGGEVDVGLGAFTFRVGPSYIITKGEIGEMVRGVSISGMILETLKSVDAVARDALVKTSIFGGCGKDGQTARVGYGGPHVRVGRVTVGGET